MDLPSQDGWQYPVKSGAEELQENTLLQFSQTFKVRKGKPANISADIL